MERSTNHCRILLFYWKIEGNSLSLCWTCLNFTTATELLKKSDYICRLWMVEISKSQWHWSSIDSSAYHSCIRNTSGCGGTLKNWLPQLWGCKSTLQDSLSSRARDPETSYGSIPKPSAGKTCSCWARSDFMPFKLSSSWKRPAHSWGQLPFSGQLHPRYLRGNI